MTSQADNTPDGAMACALRLLAMRSHSSEELTRKLLRKGYGKESTERVIEKLAGEGILDDREFGKEFIGSRSKRKPAGKLKLSAELQRKGVPEPVIGELLREIDSSELCLLAAEKKFALLRGPSEAARKKKLEAFLRNRGFSWQEILKALERFFPGVKDRQEPF